PRHRIDDDGVFLLHRYFAPGFWLLAPARFFYTLGRFERSQFQPRRWKPILLPAFGAERNGTSRLKPRLAHLLARPKARPFRAHKRSTIAARSIAAHSLTPLRSKARFQSHVGVSSRQQLRDHVVNGVGRRRTAGYEDIDTHQFVHRPRRGQ